MTTVRVGEGQVTDKNRDYMDASQNGAGTNQVFNCQRFG